MTINISHSKNAYRSDFSKCFAKFSAQNVWDVINKIMSPAKCTCQNQTMLKRLSLMKCQIILSELIRVVSSFDEHTFLVLNQKVKRVITTCKKIEILYSSRRQEMKDCYRHMYNYLFRELIQNFPVDH